MEQGFVGQDQRPQRVIVMADVHNGRAYLLDPAARTSSPVPRSLAQMMVGAGGPNKYVISLSRSRFWSFFQVPDGRLDPSNLAGAESLGQRDIAGLETTGMRFATRLPAGITGSGRAERWVSPELKVVVYSRSEDAVVGILEYRLTGISREEPPADLFDVPAEYMESPAPFPLTWQNPYNPDLDRSLRR